MGTRAIAAFWESFAREAPSIMFPPSVRQLERISNSLREVDPRLELTISKSAGGMVMQIGLEGPPDLVSLVHALCAAAPIIPGWLFRPRMPGRVSVRFDFVDRGDGLPDAATERALRRIELELAMTSAELVMKRVGTGVCEMLFQADDAAAFISRSMRLAAFERLEPLFRTEEDPGQAN